MDFRGCCGGAAHSETGGLTLPSIFALATFYQKQMIGE